MSWLRFHTKPRHWLRGATLASLSPRGKWLYERSRARYEASAMGKAMANVGRAVMPACEVGIIESFRFIATNQ